MIKVRIIDELEPVLRALSDEGGRMPVVYVTHPVGGDVAANHANALIWMRLLLRKYPWIAFVAPWLVDVYVLDDDDPEQRAAALLRCRAAVSRCDALLLVGGRISSGMRDEIDAAGESEAWIIDATEVGHKAPLEALAERAA